MKSFDETWEKIHETTEWGKYPAEPIIRFVARNYYKEDRKSIKILDYGCGAGSHTWYLAREGFDTYAFDGSKSAVERERTRLQREGLEAKFNVSDALQLNYEQNFFNCIIDAAVVYANKINDIILMFKNIYGMLKKGGKLFSISFSTATTGYKMGKEIEKNTFIDIEKGSLKDRGTVHFFEEEELYTLLSEIGFKDIKVDKMWFTDNGNIVEEFLVQAEK